MQRKAKNDSAGERLLDGAPRRPGPNDLLDAMAAPDPLTTSPTPEGLADVAAADLEEALRSDDAPEPEVDADAAPPNPYRKQPG